jgi:hypothetical protein
LRVALGTALLLLSTSLASGAVPPRLSALIREHCVRCHDDRNDLDLRTLPVETDTVRWSKMLEMVESSRMPPPVRSGAIERRFPLDPSSRQELVDAIHHLLGAKSDPPPDARRMPYTVWATVVTALARPALTPSQVSATLAEYGFYTAVPDPITPQDQVSLTRAGEAVCRQVARVEAANPRTLLGRIASRGRPGPREADELVTALYLRAIGDRPPPPELEDGRKLLARVTTRWPEPWIALCVSLLSGPRLLYLANWE